MSEKTTVFIIGAGAGHDYGMPLGEDLINQISVLIGQSQFVRSELPGRSGRRAAERATEAVDGFDNALVSHFGEFQEIRIRNILLRIRSALVFSRSIDTLLTDAGDYDISAVGKIAISHVIANAEAKAGFFYEKGELLRTISPLKRIHLNGKDITFRQTWMSAFFRDLRAGLSQSQLEKRLSEICIVNFNYDRLIERFLDTAFMQYDGLDLHEAMRLRSLIKIIHPYGMLAKYPPQLRGLKDVLDRVEFGEVVVRDQLKHAPKTILTYDETIDDSLGSEIKVTVAGADRLIFLGFGFHPQNLRLLGLPLTFGDADQKRIYASSRGISEAKRSRLQHAIMQRLNDFGDEIEDRCYFDMETCLELINEHGDDFFPSL